MVRLDEVSGVAVTFMGRLVAASAADLGRSPGLTINTWIVIGRAHGCAPCRLPW